MKALTILENEAATAVECFKQTKRHEAAILALTTIAAVDNYDFTTGYPEKLSL